MKLSLLMSNGEAVALASRLLVMGASPRIATADAPLPDCDWFVFDEGPLLASPAERASARRLVGEALSLGRPGLAFLSPNAPATPKCAVAFSELLSFASCAVVTPSCASEILGIDAEPGSDPEAVRALGDDEGLLLMAAFARTLLEENDLTFSLVFDPDAERGVLFASGAYDIITAESVESAVAELFRSADS